MTRYSYLVIRSEFRKCSDVENSVELLFSRPVKAFTSRKKALLYLRNLSSDFNAKNESCKVVSSSTICNVYFPANSLGFSYNFEYLITSLKLE